MDAIVRVRVTPRAGRDAVGGWQEGVLRVRLAAPPVEGKANEALVRFLAKALGVAQRDVEIVSGETAREKRLRIAGLSLEEVQRRLSA